MPNDIEARKALKEIKFFTNWRTAKLSEVLGISCPVINSIMRGGQSTIAKTSYRSIMVERSKYPDKLPFVKLDKEFYTTMEAARILRMGQDYVFRRVRNGILQAKRDGQRYLITKESLQELLEKRR